jgi:predicted nucleotidyltransferase
MAKNLLPPDFRDFLRLLNSAGVEYLLVGGYAVAYHGYPRGTADIDIWVAVNPDNASRTAQVLRDFGFAMPEVAPELFLSGERVVRMGVPPIRIEVLTAISGVSFEDCYARRVTTILDGVPVSIIGLEDLKTNKRAAGRHKDLDDLENLG